jgi:capsular exopolysaccharide synthesis family protein
MTYRDDDPSHASDSQRAMVGGAHPPGDALVVQSNGAPTAMAFPATPMTPPADVLRGGMDANTFVHALRRRWLLAVCMGTVLAAAAAAALWFMFPASSSATALFRVAAKPEYVLVDMNRTNPQSFETLKKTQLALLRSDFVLTSAIRKPGIASLSVLAGEPDAVEWLQENLQVQFPEEGEILSIALAGDEPFATDLVTLVDAVAHAYDTEVLAREKQKKLTTRDLLARSLDNLKEEIGRKWDEYMDIAREADRPTSVTDAETDLLLKEIQGMLGRKNELEQQMYEMQTNYAITKAQLEDPALIEMKVDEALAADPQMGMIKNQLGYAQQQLAAVTGTSARPNSRAAQGWQQKIQMYQAQIDGYRQQVRAEMTRSSQGQSNLPLQQATKLFQLQFGSLRNQYAAIDKQLQDIKKKLKTRMERSVELDARERDLEQLEQISKDMSIKLENIDIEAQAPPQIEKVQNAVLSKGNSKAQQTAISAFGGLGAFAVTCFGIGYLEFRNRRLNDPDQVDEGLGIRVIGTLPSLSRYALDPTHPIVAQLTESIDGVRTILMHDSTSKRRQVVLVTSAATMEGRTTVASQLAASLARAGRRTLLVDGDLRRPALHALFDVPLEDGLCEVLRAEVDVADVIRPTHAEGLWLLTAGYCDIDAIHALATEQMQPVFDKLRSEYDFVIIDGAPLLGMSDALIFGQYSDGAILSVRRDHSQMPKINHAAGLLRDVGIRIIGSVVNGVPAKADDRIIQLRLIAPKSERELQPTG